MTSKIKGKRKKKAPWRRYKCSICKKIIVHNWRERHALHEHRGKSVSFKEVRT